MKDTLKFSEQEKIMYDSIFEIIELKQKECDESDNETCNIMHTKLVRTDDGNLKEVRSYCKKQQKQLSKNLLKYNDLGSKTYNMVRSEEGKIVSVKLTDAIKNNNGAYICGTYETGKTFLLYSFMQFLLKKFNQNKTIGYVDLIITFKKMCSNFEQDEKYLNDKLINELKNIDILLIDNLGDERKNKLILEEYIMELLEYRLLHNKPTFFTSKFSLQKKELEKTYLYNKETPVYLVNNLINKIQRLTKNTSEIFIETELFKK